MFVLGNHDYHFSSIKETHEIVKRACEKHENLLWLSSVGHVSVNSRVAIVGTEGWYDGMVGDPRWLRYTTDWALIDDFREMTPGDRLSTWRKMAMDSAINTTKRLESALCGHETVYVVTHVCPWVNGAGEESFGGVLRNLWRAYNVNCSLGHSIDYVGDKVPHKKIIVLSGHTHVNKRFFSRENVECRVGHGCSLFGLSRLIENKFFV
jgi:predicted phosphohydrolase